MVTIIWTADVRVSHAGILKKSRASDWLRAVAISTLEAVEEAVATETFTGRCDVTLRIGLRTTADRL